jgi:hypothetical protein
MSQGFSQGSFTHNVIDEAWNILEKLSDNIDNCDIDKSHK